MILLAGEIRLTRVDVIKDVDSCPILLRIDIATSGDHQLSIETANPQGLVLRTQCSEVYG
jgi:hypothetical protein